MTELVRFFVRATAATVLCLALVSWPVYTYLGGEHLRAVFAGSLVGMVNIVIAWVYNKKALSPEKEKQMMSSLLSGMMVRFLVVGGAVLAVAKLTDLNVYTFSFALLGFYLILQVFEVHFIQKQLSQSGK